MEKQKKPKKLVCSIIVFVIGMATMIVGVVFLVVSSMQRPAIEDGDYLVSASEWVLEDGTNCVDADGETESTETNSGETNCLPRVIWNFTEIGKGTLTTNGHINDYDFIWAIEDGKLLIETKWLYDLENEYEYELNQKDGILALTDGDNQYQLVASFEKSE